jgi:hypothetical protein
MSGIERWNDDPELKEQVIQDALENDGIARCGAWLAYQPEGGDVLVYINEDCCVRTGIERIEELDDLTLEEYPHRVDLQVSILADPENHPEEYAELIRMHVKDALSEVPHAVDADVTDRAVEPDTDRSAEGQR